MCNLICVKMTESLISLDICDNVWTYFVVCKMVAGKKMVTVKQYCVLILTDFIYLCRFCTFFTAISFVCHKSQHWLERTACRLSSELLSRFSFSLIFHPLDLNKLLEVIIIMNIKWNHPYWQLSVHFCSAIGQSPIQWDFGDCFPVNVKHIVMIQQFHVKIQTLWMRQKDGQKCCKSKNGINEFVHILRLETPK